MISYFLIFSSLLISLYPTINKTKNKDYLYALIFTSFSVSHLILGFISLLIINLNISKFPIILISFVNSYNYFYQGGEIILQIFNDI